MRERLSAEYNKKWMEQKQLQEKEFGEREAGLRQLQTQLEQQRLNQEAELKKRLAEEAEKARQQMEQSIREQAQKDVAAKLRFLEEKSAGTEQLLRESQQKEYEFLKKQQEYQAREAALELEKQKAVAAESIRMQEEMRKAEEERIRLHDEKAALRMREYEKQLEDQKKLIEEMKRKSDQGSMQLQGEVQELELEDLLRSSFPYDVVNEVKKGQRGADCILTVRNSYGANCGRIIFESKRTQAFGGEWIDKLKADMAAVQADVAVIVTQTFPKDMDRFGERQGVYICSFAEVKSLVTVLRSAVLKFYELRKSQENKGEKMAALYDYLTSQEFSGPWLTMRESFQNLRRQLQKERDDFEKNWKKKEKTLDLIIQNSMRISGSIEGISGIETMEWNNETLSTGDTPLLE